MGSLSGRVAVVTGAAQGLGYAIAKALCDRGATVGIADINELKIKEAADRLRSSGCSVFPLVVDVTSVESLKQMVDEISKNCGALDILVNNAGILFSTKIEDITPKEWDKVLSVNLSGTFFAVQQALPLLKKSPSPRIINISSLAGRMGGYETGMSYTASKGGVISLTYGLARHLAPYGITVNCVCPGTTETPIIQQWTPAQRSALEEKIPLGRLGAPTDIGNAVAFLAGDEASFITGLLLDVNGGMYFG